MECKICGKIIKNTIGLSRHIQSHNIKLLEYRKKYDNFEIPKCIICGCDVRIISSNKYSKTCTKDVCKKQNRINVAIISGNTASKKEKMRKIRFNYLNKKAGKTAWEQRASGKMSYLEKWFYDNVIVKYNLLDKYDIISEHPEYPYFIDFAFLNIKLAVEMDGKQHFHDMKRIEHDVIKDAHLKEKGWKIFRIAYDELNEKKIKEILNVINNIEEYSPKILTNILIKYTEYKKITQKHRTRQEYFEHRKNEFEVIVEQRIEKILNSNIDFSKSGWVIKTSKLLNMKHQKVSVFMKKHMPEFYAKCFKRNFS